MPVLLDCETALPSWREELLYARDSKTQSPWIWLLRMRCIINANIFYELVIKRTYTLSNPGPYDETPRAFLKVKYREDDSCTHGGRRLTPSISCITVQGEGKHRRAGLSLSLAVRVSPLKVGVSLWPLHVANDDDDNPSRERTPLYLLSSRVLSRHLFKGTTRSRCS